MRILSGKEEKHGELFIGECIKQAALSTCQRARCGSVIVSSESIIGRGYNSPPGNKESQRKCTCKKEDYDKKVTDKTCCIHAEQRAIIDALKNHPEKIKNSTIYFARIDKDNKLIFSGAPYCTICSKLALDVGITEFVLGHEQGITVYSTEEYNEISYEFNG